MPILKHAKKKMRQDKKRTLANRKVKDAYKKQFKNAVKLKTAQALSKAYQAIDKAAKQNILHQNKAARLKSSLAKLIPDGGTKKKASAVTKETKVKVKKSPAKATKK